jgi:hypothetical protein
LTSSVKTSVLIMNFTMKALFRPVLYACNFCCEFLVQFTSDGCERVDELRMFWVRVSSSQHSYLIYSFTSIRRENRNKYCKHKRAFYCRF